MATIERRTTKDGKAAYRVKIRRKGYPMQTETFTRLTDARKWAQLTEAAIEEGRLSLPKILSGLFHRSLVALQSDGSPRKIAQLLPLGRSPQCA